MSEGLSSGPTKFERGSLEKRVVPAIGRACRRKFVMYSARAR